MPDFKKIFIIPLLTFLILCVSGIVSAQSLVLGTAADHVLFTSVGALSNTGITKLTGNIGTNSGSITGYGNVNGNVNSSNGASNQCASDVLSLYNQLNALVNDFFIAPLIGNNDTLVAGVYSIGAPSTLNGVLNLNAKGNPNAVFVIKVQGALSVNANAKVRLVNGALACNVFWKIEGLVDISSNVSIVGTIVANNAAITLNSGDTLQGRALSTAGAITTSGTMAFIPTGCGRAVPVGPAAPALGAATCYALFSSTGDLINTGVTNVTGDVGSNNGSAAGYNALLVNGTIHTMPDPSTAACAGDLTIADTYLNNLPTDIQLLFPAQFGNDLVLTPHTYLLNSATSMTGSLFLDALGNPNAVFVIKVVGAFSTSTFSKVVLLNGTKPENVFWKINGAVHINDNSEFYGTMVVKDGAINLGTNVQFVGRALTTSGAMSTTAMTIVMPAGCCASGSNVIATEPVNKTACVGDTVKFSVVANGTSLTYQWRKGNVNLVNGLKIAGATSDTLVLKGVLALDSALNYNVIVSSSCPKDTSINARLTVNSPALITTEPISKTACIGTTVTLKVTATGTNLSFQWRKGNVNLNNTGNISGVTDSILVFNSVNLSDTANNYNVVVRSACGNDTSINATLVVTPLTVIGTEPVSVIACLGGNVNFTVVSAGSNLTYQWRKGNINLINSASITGVTAATLVINPAGATDAANNYNVIVSGTCGKDTSANTTLTISPSTVIDTEPIAAITCLGGNVSFTATAVGTNLTYQWRKGNVNLTNSASISGVNSTTLGINPVAGADAALNYNVIVSGTCGKDTSINASLTINPTTVIGTEPVSAVTCIGGNVNFTVASSGTNLTYQWRKGTVNLTNSASISGVTTATLGINPVASADAALNYNVIVSGTCGKDTSLNASLILNKPTVTSQPTDAAACIGNSASFTAIASGTNLSYQWRKGNINLSNSASISGVNSATLFINPVAGADAASNYNVIISNSCGSDTSISVALLLNSSGLIVTEPTSQSVCSGSSTSLMVTTSGVGVIYKWRKGTVDLINGANIAGANTNTLTINPVSASDVSTLYNVVVSTNCGNDTSAFASVVIIAKATITTQPISKTACIGDAISYSVVATGTNPTYQWRNGTTALINSGAISGVNSSTLTLSPVNGAHASSNYNVIVLSACGNDTSVSVALTVTTNALITTQPVNQVVCLGNSASFNVAASGTGLTYKWRKGNVDLVNGANIAGANSATLAIANVSGADIANNYNVVVNGTCGTDTSVFVTLTNNPTLIITSEPANQVACIGGAANFSVNASGTAPAYQWRKGNVNLVNNTTVSGANSAFLTINPVSAVDYATNYNVIVITSCGNDTSNFASLTNDPTQIIKTEPINKQSCAGNSVSLAVDAVGTNLTYQWKKGTVNLLNGPAISGANSATLTFLNITPADAANNYNVIVGSSCGNDTSVFVSIGVTPGPSIVTEPSAQVACEGSSVVFKATASGINLSYQWRKGNVNLLNNASTAGATTNTLIISGITAADAHTNYNVVVLDTCGTITSQPASLTVVPATKITSEPTNEVACSGTAAIFTVAATGTNLTYQWRKGNVVIVDGGSISGAQTTQLTINPMSAADKATDYNAIVTGDCGNDTSLFATLTDDPSLIIVNEPGSQQACENGSASFTVVASGVNLSYQWRKGNVALVNGATVSGAQSATLVLSQLSAADDATNYNVLVNSTCGEDTSLQVALIVAQQPVAIASGNSPICAGNTLQLTAQTVGGSSYSWTSSTGFTSTDQNPTITSVSAINAGTYSLTVTTGICVSTPSTVTVVVNPCDVDLSLVKSVDNIYPVVGSTVVFTIVASNNGVQVESGLIVTEILKSGYSYISSTTTAGTYNPSTGTWIIGTLTGGTSATLEISATVLPQGDYSNTANIRGTNAEVDTTNNTSSVQTFPTSVNTPTGLHIPEGFSPNGDGINELYVIKGLEYYPANSLVIFNRWGSKVFAANNYKNTWEGNNTQGLQMGGGLLPAGTYFYILNLGDGSADLKGTIYLQR